MLCAFVTRESIFISGNNKAFYKKKFHFFEFYRKFYRIDFCSLVEKKKLMGEIQTLPSASPSARNTNIDVKFQKINWRVTF